MNPLQIFLIWFAVAATGEFALQWFTRKSHRTSVGAVALEAGFWIVVFAALHWTLGWIPIWGFAGFLTAMVGMPLIFLALTRKR